MKQNDCVFTLDEIRAFNQEELLQFEIQSHRKLLIDNTCIEKLLEFVREDKRIIDVNGYDDSKGNIDGFLIQNRQKYVYACCIDDEKGDYLISCFDSPESIDRIILLLRN